MTHFLRRHGFSTVIFTLGAACLVYGVTRGEAAVVLQKAVLICLECIGIG